jgi:hypothetical protein
VLDTSGLGLEESAGKLARLIETVAPGAVRQAAS